MERRGLLELDFTSHPDHWSKSSWQSCIEQMHIDFDIAFYGNSITRGGDFQSFFPDKRIINLGISGDNLVGLKQRYGMLKAANPKKCFVMIGVNDIYSISLETFERRYKDLVSTLREGLPCTELYLLSLLPMNHDIKRNLPSNDIVKKANVIISEIAAWGGQNTLIYIRYMKRMANYL